MSRDHENNGVSRRSLLQVGAGLAGSALLPTTMYSPAFAQGTAEHPPIGTYPAGSAGSSVRRRASRARRTIASNCSLSNGFRR